MVLIPFRNTIIPIMNISKWVFCIHLKTWGKMRRYNCVSYLRCLVSAASSDADDICCEKCVSFNLHEHHADEEQCYSEGLACCRLLLAAYVYPPVEPVVDLPYGWRVAVYYGRYVAVRRSPGTKRKILYIESVEEAESKINEYLNKGLN